MGRSLLVYGLLIGEQLHTRGDLVLSHYDSQGTQVPNCIVGRPYRKQHVLAWFCGPYLRLCSIDGTFLMTRPLPHPVGHEFIMFKPWRGPDMHVMSLRRRIGVDDFVVYFGPGAYTLRPRRLPNWQICVTQRDALQ
jgi:hypothetical protein